MANMLGKVRHAIWWLLHEWLYDLGWFVGRTLGWIVSDYTIIGRENFPGGGAGVIVTSNHLSMWDLPFIHNIMPRSFYTMTKLEFLNVPVVGGLSRLVGAFPVKRGTPDRKSLQTSVDLLKKGKLLAIFPEGHRSDHYALGEGHSGAALVALNSDAWILPVAISGTEFVVRKRKGLFSRPKVTVRIGKPYKLSRTNSEGKRQSLEELSDYMMSKIAELLPPEYQGLYSPEKLAERRAERTRVAEEQASRAAEKRAARKSQNGHEATVNEASHFAVEQVTKQDTSGEVF